jgi:hypothetical protein
MSLTLPHSKASSGGDLLSLFLGLRQIVNWILAAPQLFRETIYELDKETRRLILFKLKMEIEEYYNENHHLSEESLIFEQVGIEQLQKLKIKEKQEYHYIITVPGREWQEMRLNYISDYSKVTLPGFCESCRSERPFLVDVFRYIDYIISAHGPYPSRGISGNCNICGTEFGTHTSVMMLPYLMAW